MPSTRATRKRLAEELPATPKRRAVKKEPKEAREPKETKEVEAKEAKEVKAVAAPRKPTLFDELDGSPAKKADGSNIEYLQSLDDGSSDSSLSELDDVEVEAKAKPKAKGKAGPKAKPKLATRPKAQTEKTGKAAKAASAKAAPVRAAPARAAKEKAKEEAKEKAPVSGIVPRKPTLFDDLDTSPAAEKKSGGSTIDVLKTLDADADPDDDDASSDSSLSDMDDDVDFEDVPLAGKEKKKEDDDEKDSDDDDDDDMEFEDVAAPPAPFSFLSMANDDDHDKTNGDGDGNLELTLVKDTRVALTTLHARDSKRAPSKMERLVRSATHCVHVQSLLYHNALRNAWLCDGEVQGLLLSHLPPRLHEEVERWERGSRSDEGGTKEVEKGKKKSKGKGKSKSDWTAAKRVPPTDDDLQHNDPLPRLLSKLATWWRRTFKVTAPGLRKTGYMMLERLDRFLTAAKAARGIDTTTWRFGERIANVAAMRAHAAALEGSRDVGAQLFTALLRAIGLEARMVGSLQPLGFGWSKMEDADAEGGESELEVAESRPAEKTAAASTPKETATSTSTPAPDELPEVNSDNESVAFDHDNDRDRDDPHPRRFDQDLPYAVYWTEVFNPLRQTYVPVDALVKHVVATSREQVEASFEPRGSKADRVRQVICYVVGHAADGTAKDVTVRYLKRQMRPGRTRGVRMPPEKVPVYNKQGKVRRYDVVDWFAQAVMRGYARGFSAAYPVTAQDAAEDASDLRAAQPEKKEVKEGDETLQYYKQSPTYVLARHLKREEALVHGAEVVKYFSNTKGAKGTKQANSDATAGEPVYLRKDVVAVKSAETWHKQGRAPKPGAVPLKHVPYRAATLNRKREIAEAEAATGDKVLQALYSENQTEWIIPPPIRDGVIPKNAYGNIDLFAAHMCPQGAVHLPFRGAARVCRKLGVDHAEAVVDFEFGHRMAVPVIQGVVVAAECEARVLAQLAKDDAERARKEDEKRRARAMGMWRKMLMGLRVVERIRHEYGEVKEVVNLGDEEEDEKDDDADGEQRETLPEGFDYEEPEQESRFFPGDDDDDDDDDVGGGFVVE